MQVSTDLKPMFSYSFIPILIIVILIIIIFIINKIKINKTQKKIVIPWFN